jgi:hypothetical protein
MNSLPIILKVPVAIYSDREDPDQMNPTHMLEREVVLPAPIIPEQFALAHCPARGANGESITLVIGINTATIRFDERLGRYIVFGRRLTWHDQSFEHAISTMGTLGWKMEAL